MYNNDQIQYQLPPGGGVPFSKNVNPPKMPVDPRMNQQYVPPTLPKSSASEKNSPPKMSQPKITNSIYSDNLRNHILGFLLGVTPQNLGLALGGNSNAVNPINEFKNFIRDMQVYFSDVQKYNALKPQDRASIQLNQLGKPNQTIYQ